ncbi:hypothetical protein QUC31_010133, partial [Theobroma cacao]
MLFRLPKLKHVWNKDPQGNISFQTLRVVNVRKCWSLKSLFPFSIANGLPQLESLLVQQCGVGEIVSKNEGLEQEIRFEFNQLSFLKLWKLTNLKCFYPGMHTIAWPVLKNLKTHGCEEIKIFGQLESHIQKSLFVIEKIIPQLEEVSFSSDDIAMICDGQFASHFFCHIKLLQITCYLDESAVFPFFFLQRFYNLEMLQVFGCNFKELSPYERNVGKDKEVRMLSKLRKLKLDSLQKIIHVGYQCLKHLKLSEFPELVDIWNGNPQEILDLKNLEFLEFCNSVNLGCIFNLSMALSLVRLQQLEIKKCNKMEAVIKEDGSVLDQRARTDKIIIFPCLKSIFIEHCPDLTSFYWGSPILMECPSLKIIEVAHCPNMTTFVSIFPRDEEKNARIGDGTERKEDDLEILPAFFCDKIIPQLEEVSFSSDDIAMICDGQFASHFFCHIKLLQITCYLDESAVLPVFFLQRFYNLEMLQVGYQCLKHLKLSEFPELMDIWNRNPQEILDLKNLEFLEFCNSDNLGCIFNLSMALSLVRLRQLEIKKCNKMEAVIKEDGSVLDQEARKDKIVIFPCLKSIFIVCCPDLTSFYLGNPTLMECPSLKKIEIAHCPNMTTCGSIFPRDEEKNARIGDGIERNEDDLEILPAFFCDK